MASVVHSMPSGDVFLRVVTQDEELTLPVVRPSQDHRSFLLSTWVRSYAAAARDGRVGVSKEVLLREEARASERLWQSSWIVTAKDDPYAIHSWVCGKAGILDYVYVPPELRMRGIASALVKFVAGDKYEHGRRWPFKGSKTELETNGTYNPYLLGRGAD
jgi:GNAT superfamily N-acetyltransferase